MFHEFLDECGQKWLTVITMLFLSPSPNLEGEWLWVISRIFSHQDAFQLDKKWL